MIAGDLFAAGAPRMRPWDYIRLRRAASGLSLQQAAAKFAGREEHAADCVTNLARLEQPGQVFSRIDWLDLTRAFPFSAGIYAQLAGDDPMMDPRLCAGCGWDDTQTAEIDLAFDPVAWARPALCTRCHQLDQQRNVA